VPRTVIPEAFGEEPDECGAIIVPCILDGYRCSECGNPKRVMKARRTSPHLGNSRKCTMRIFIYALILVSSVGIGAIYGTRESARRTEQQAELKAAQAKQQAEREGKQELEREDELKAERQADLIREAELQAEQRRQTERIAARQGVQEAAKRSAQLAEEQGAQQASRKPQQRLSSKLCKELHRSLNISGGFHSNLKKGLQGTCSIRESNMPAKCFKAKSSDQVPRKTMPITISGFKSP